MNRLLTAKGKEIPCSFFGIAGVGVLFADVETDLLTAANVFSDKDETETITYIYDNNGEESKREARGFTSVLSLSPLYGENPGIRVGLQRPFAEME